MDTTYLRRFALAAMLMAGIVNLFGGAAPPKFPEFSGFRAIGPVTVQTNPTLGTVTINSTNLTNFVQQFGGDTNWVFDGSTLRPQTANSVTVTNLDVWTRLIAKGSFITETRSRTLVLGSNHMAVLTNSFLLLDSPTNDPGEVTVYLGSAASSGQELTVLANLAGGAFTMIDGSVSGAGNLYLQGDFVANADGRGLFLKSRGNDWIEIGRFNISNSAPASVNPTIGFLPYNQDGVSFGDSPLYRFGTNQVSITNTSGNIAGLRLRGTNITSYLGQNDGQLELTNTTTIILQGGTTRFDITGDVFQPPVNNSGRLGQLARRWNIAYLADLSVTNIYFGADTSASIRETFGSGSPEGVVIGPVGSLYHRSDGGAGTSIYVKESGAGNTGWVALGAGGGGGGSIWTNTAGQYSPTEANAESLRFGSNTTSASEFTIALGVRNVIGTSSGASGILSGTNNWISNSIVGGVIAGGNRNTIRTGAATTPTIGGGSDNIVRANYGTVAGGIGNDVRLAEGFIGGGDNNIIGSAGAQTAQGIVAGSQNVANGLRSFIGGGLANSTDLNSAQTSIVGGEGNTTGGVGEFIGGGALNVTVGSYDVIVGGYTNYVSATYGFIGSGISNRVGGTSFGSFYSSVVGGASNIVVDGGDYSAILGGARNAVSADFGAILGGTRNSVTTNHGVVIAGFDSHATATNAVAIGSRTTNSTANSVAIPVGVFPITNAIAGQVMTSAGGINGQMYWATPSGGAGDGTGPFTNSVGTISNSVAGSNFVFTAYFADAAGVAYTLKTSDLLASANLLRIATSNQTRFLFTPLGGISMGTTNLADNAITSGGDGTFAFGQATGTNSSGDASYIEAQSLGTLSGGQALNGGYIAASGVGAASLGFADTGGGLESTLWASFVFASATNGVASSTARGALAGGIAQNADLTTSGDAGFTWGRNIVNSGANAFAYGNNFTNASNNVAVFGWGGRQFVINPAVVDGASAVAYTFDTANLLVDNGALLVAFANQGTNAFTFSGNGELFITGPLAELYVHSVGETAWGSLSTGDENAPKFAMGSDGLNGVNFEPGIANGNTPFILTSTKAHTSPTELLRLQHLGVTHFTMRSTNGIATPQITAYGYVSTPWQFGDNTNNISVLSSATNTLTVTVNGTKYVIPAAKL